MLATGPRPRYTGNVFLYKYHILEKIIFQIANFPLDQQCQILTRGLIFMPMVLIRNYSEWKINQNQIHQQSPIKSVEIESLEMKKNSPGM